MKGNWPWRGCAEISGMRKPYSIPLRARLGITSIYKNTCHASQDGVNEIIRFQLALQVDGTYNLQKAKNDTGPPTADLASNVRNNLTDFTVTRDAGNEIQLYLRLSLTSGENVTLQTRVYPKNLPKDATFKNFCQNWMEAYQ